MIARKQSGAQTVRINLGVSLERGESRLSQTMGASTRAGGASRQHTWERP